MSIQNNLSYAKMKNQAGKVLSPSLETFAAAAANADWAGSKNFHVIITNQPGDKSWPIAASTWVLIHTNPDNAGQRRRGPQVLRLGLQERRRRRQGARLRRRSRTMWWR